MKIVIDIPDKKYHAILNHAKEILDPFSFIEPQYLYLAVINGTPLPKRHGRIIDESKITQVYYHEEKAEQGAINFRGIVVDRTDAPTIIEADTESEEV